MAVDGMAVVDRRDGLRRRIYLACLVVGTPVLTATWVVQGPADTYIAWVYPPYVAVNVVVAVGLWRHLMSVRTAERVVLVANAAVYLSGLAIAILGSAQLVEVDSELTGYSVLTINLLVMLSYVSFETRDALRLSVGMVGTFVVIVAIRIAPDAVDGVLPSQTVGYLRTLMFLVASVGLLHILAQVKEQAAEARSTAAAMTAMAHTDQLTGVANRRHLLNALDDLVDRVGTDEALAVLLFDIDHFKGINDTYGHDAGDDALQEISATLARAVREGDLFGRWGGEEFLVIAEGTDAAAATRLAERCRTELRSTRIAHVGTVTASVGVASHHAGENSWELLRRADLALYAAKAAGRDRVVHHAHLGVHEAATAEAWAPARARRQG